MNSYLTFLTLICLFYLTAIQGKYCTFTQPNFTFGDADGQWDYKDFSKWGALKGSVCASGNRQSPINVITSQAVDTVDTVGKEFDSVDMTVQKKPYHMEVDGIYQYVTTIDLQSGNNVVYVAKNIHLHTPSEHLLDGKKFPMEIHFVLYSDDSNAQGCDLINTKLITYAVFVEIDEYAKNIDFLDSWANQAKSEVIPGFNLYNSLLSLLPSTVPAYLYEGSFAIPPCTEFMEYIVLSESIKLTSTQYQLIHSYTSDLRYFLNGYNARPINPLNGRVIYKTNFVFESYDTAASQSTLSAASPQSTPQQSTPQQQTPQQQTLQQQTPVYSLPSYQTPSYSTPQQSTPQSNDNSAQYTSSPPSQYGSGGY